MRTSDFFGYARERYTILRKRRAGHAAPWTSDPVLQQYRFCNVFREDDRVTEWFRENIRKPLGTGYTRLFRATVVFRYLNRIETGERIRDPLLTCLTADLLLGEIELRLRQLVQQREKILGPAYMIKTPVGKDKVTGLLEIWRDIFSHEEQIVKTARVEQSIRGLTEALAERYFCGPFMAYEIATDLRHSPFLGRASDTLTWANPGPGAMRGAARVLGDEASSLSRGNTGDVDLVQSIMGELLSASRDNTHWPSGWPRWELREVEHTLCEFDKYERARTGEGRPKQLYKGRA